MAAPSPEPQPLAQFCTISVYPAQGAASSSESQLSALAEYSRNLLQSLDEESRRRHLVLTCLKGPEPKSFEDNGILVEEVWTKGGPKFAGEILEALKRHPNLRVIHLQHEFNQFGRAYTVPLVLCLLFLIRFHRGIKTVVTLHEVFDPSIFSGKTSKALRLPLNGLLGQLVLFCYFHTLTFLVDRVLVQHEEARHLMLRVYRSRAPVSIVPLGVPTRVQRVPQHVARTEISVAADKKVLLFFGTLDWRRGLDILIEAFHRLPPDFELIIAGGQPVRIKHTTEYKTWLQSVTESASRNPNIRMLGFVSDRQVSELHSMANLVVLPYRLPQRVSATLNTAVAYEVPYIASRALGGTVPEFALFELTPEAIAHKIVWAFEEGLSGLRAELQSYKALHSFEHSASLQRNVYLDLVRP